jgi:hypothetical protein
MSFNAWLALRREQSAVSSEDEGGAQLELPNLAASEEEPAPPMANGVDAQPVHEALRNCEQELFASAESNDPAYLPCVEHFRAGLSFQIGDITVTPFTIPHDAADPVGFVLQTEGMRIVIATDLGYMAPNVRMHLQRADLLMLESNHDVEMLRDGPYPWAVKQRVLSRVGHLSNDAVSEYLADEYDGGARFLILAHISESNNLPELARISAERALESRMGLLANKVLLASQSTPLESIQL